MKTQERAVNINRAENRFELEMEGKLSFVAYMPLDDKTLVLTHTEVQARQEGSSVGPFLIRGMLEYIERNNLKIIPFCAFVAAYLKRHPEYNHLISPDYRVKN
ncbi:GNAT family N-acetyltransferase [Larkinella ripae]